MGWLVDLDKPVFNGRKALMEEKANGSRYRFAILDVAGNKPAHNSFILKNGKQVGVVTSAAWCPTAKTNVALAQLEMPHGAVGDELVAEALDSESDLDTVNLRNVYIGSPRNPGQLAFVFPGQGAQTIGMGKALAEAYPTARAVFSGGFTRCALLSRHRLRCQVCLCASLGEMVSLRRRSADCGALQCAR